QRQSQSYCSPACRRAAAYGRERFAAGTTGRRRRRLKASDKAPGIPIAGSFRNGDFSSIETARCKPTNWIEKLNQRDAHDINQAYWLCEKRKWPIDLMGGAIALGGQHLRSILSCVRASSTPSSYSRTTS